VHAAFLQTQLEDIQLALLNHFALRVTTLSGAHEARSLPRALLPAHPCAQPLSPVRSHGLLVPLELERGLTRPLLHLLEDMMRLQ